MTQPTRFIGERDGDRYLLEATAEIRQAEGGDWWHVPDALPRYCRPGESTAYDYVILRELCKLETPEGFELVNNGVEEFKTQVGDECYVIGRDYWVTSTGPTRAPVCRPIAKEETTEAEDVGCQACNGSSVPHERTHVCNTCYEEAVAESDTLRKERDRIMLDLRDERRKSCEILAVLKRHLAAETPPVRWCHHRASICDGGQCCGRG